MSIEEIARIFKVPTILIGHPDKAATYASVEQQMLAFITHTIRPWTSRIEQSITKSLLYGRDKKKYFAEFNLNDFVRGDIKTRFEAYAIARQWGWMNRNEIRARENLNELSDAEGGNDYLTPMNMVIAGKEEEMMEKQNGGKDEDDKDEMQG
jgi:HK97 family phage portal protein